MTSTRITDRAAGAQEWAINTGLDRDGIGQRICLHADRTVHREDDGSFRLECDYCPALARWITGATDARLPAWYWPVP